MLDDENSLVSMFKELAKDKERKEKTKSLALKEPSMKAPAILVKHQTRNGRVDSSSSKGVEQKRQSNVTAEHMSTRKK